MKPEVVQITPALVRGAAQAAADGFVDNEIWVWMLRGDCQRRRLLPRHYRAMIRRVYMPRAAALDHARRQGSRALVPTRDAGAEWRERFAELLSLLPGGSTACRARRAGRS